MRFALFSDQSVRQITPGATMMNGVLPCWEAVWLPAHVRESSQN